MIPARVRPAAATVLLAILVVTAGCAASTAPGELVPGLRTQLAQVDRALAARDYAEARDELDTLVELTSAARDDGRITPEQADRILAAVTRLAAELPEPTARPAPSRATSAPPPSTGDGGTPSDSGDRQTETGEATDEGEPTTGPESSGGPDDGRANATSAAPSPPAAPTP